MVTGVNNASDCCLGSGLSFREGGTCRQCIGKQLIICLYQIIAIYASYQHPIEKNCYDFGSLVYFQ